jgi:AbrB family looped-hinge helix DNA binding protein
VVDVFAHQGDLINKIGERHMVRAATTKLSSRGQVVIPEEIRGRLGLEAGDHFVVVGEGDVVVLKAIEPPKIADFGDLLDRARQSAEKAGLTPDDVERAIREARAKK